MASGLTDHIECEERDRLEQQLADIRIRVYSLKDLLDAKSKRELEQLNKTWLNLLQAVKRHKHKHGC